MSDITSPQLFLFCAFIVNFICNASGEITHYQPEQIHLSLSGYLQEMVVTWTTLSPTNESIVEYGIDEMILSANGTSFKFIDGGKKKRYIFIHQVILSELEPNSTYVYHCGSNLGWSNKFSFKTYPLETDWSPRVAVFGDLGVTNAQSLPRLQKEAQEGLYDAVLHIGDFAYDMDDDDGRVGDEFMRQIESIAGYVPYMTAPGNHEERYNFSHYRARFSMPGENENLFYSFDLGPIHFVVISTEVYYYLNYGIKLLVEQYEWLNKDLWEASLEFNKAVKPWIVVLGHRPMYCSNDDRDDCTFEEDILRVGIPFLKWYGIEEMLYFYKVDLEIWAHEHSYERTWPLFDGKVYNGSYDEPYTNPKAPVHIITGSAGCNEFVDRFKKEPKPWSAFRSSDYGYLRLMAYNNTHLHIEQVSDDEDGAVIDSFWLIKNRTKKYFMNMDENIATP